MSEVNAVSAIWFGFALPLLKKGNLKQKGVPENLRGIPCHLNDIQEFNPSKL